FLLSGFCTPLSQCYNRQDTVGVAQLAEHRTVAPDVVGSIPISHPILSRLFSLRDIRRLRKRSGGCWANVCKWTGIVNPNSGALLTGRSERLVSQADNFL